MLILFYLCGVCVCVSVCEKYHKKYQAYQLHFGGNLPSYPRKRWFDFVQKYASISLKDHRIPITPTKRVMGTIMLCDTLGTRHTGDYNYFLMMILMEKCWWFYIILIWSKTKPRGNGWSSLELTWGIPHIAWQLTNITQHCGFTYLAKINKIGGT